MTITVKAPNGVTLNFPDGTDQATISRAMQQATGGAAASVPPAKPSPLESTLRGGADTAAMGFLDEGGAILAIDPIEGAISGNWSQQYDKKLKEIRAKQEAAQQANPEYFLGGQIGGGVLSMLVPGAAPVRGASLIRQIPRLSAVGGALGGIYGAGSADDGDRLMGAGQGALWGTSLGAATPLVGRTLGAGYRALSGLRQGATGGAADLMARAAGSDNLADALTMQRELQRLGPEAMPADLGPNLQRQTGALASVPGSAQETVRDALVARQQGANARVTGDIDTTLGPAPIPSRVDAGIVDAQRALGPQYQAALANARAVDTSDIALLLDSQAVNLRGDAQRAVQEVRRMLNVAGTDQLDPNPGTLLATRQAIDGRLATEANPNAIRVLTYARGRINEVLADAVPGIRDVDAQFAELARQRDALQRGQTVLQSGREAPRPVELAEEVAAGALPQGTAVGPSAVPLRLRQGARAEIDRIVGTNTNDVVALQKLIKGEGSWNRDRLATLFGEDRADAIIRILDRERAFAETSSVVMRNSETAARLAAQQEVAPTSDATAGVVRSLLNLRAGDAAATGLDATFGGALSAARTRRNEALGRMLTSQGPQASAAVQSVAEAIARRNRQLAIEQGINLAIAPSARGYAASRQ